MGCISSANLSIFVNGRPKGEILAEKGLRQGDPLSLFLFTILGDSLSHLIHNCNERRMLRGFRVGYQLAEVTHFQYVDDSLFFLPQFDQNAKILAAHFESLCMVQVCLQKSCLFD